MAMEENLGERIAVACPGCAGRFQVKSALAGKSVKCPRCGVAFQVPVPEEEPAAEIPAQPGSRARRGERRGREAAGRPGRTSQAKKGAGKGLLFGGLGVLVVLVLAGVILALQGAGGPPSDFVQAREGIPALAQARQIPAWLELAERAAKAEWAGAPEQAAGALEAAEGVASSLEGHGAVNAYLEGARLLAAGRRADRASSWLHKAAAAARAISAPEFRTELLSSLAARLESEEGVAGAAGMAPGLFREALAAAADIQGPKRTEALLDLESRLPKEGEVAQLREQLFRRVIEADPDHVRAREGLGHMRVPKDSPLEEDRGRWLETDTQKRIYSNKIAQIEQAAEEQRKDDERWTKDRFGRASARLRQEMEREITGVKWHWFFDDEFIKRPYLMAVEESQSPSTEGIAREQGRVLNAMVTNFYKYFQQLLDLADPNRPLGVFIFSSKGSYAEFQKKNPNSFPDPQGIGGFFKGDTTRMYLWAQDETWGGGRPMDLPAIMFHEGTHQLMHYHKQSPGPQIGNSPWLQEGLAEYFGGYYTRFVPGTYPPVQEFRNGKFQKGRYNLIFTPALASIEQSKAVPGILPLKDLIYLGYDRFREIQWGRERNPHLVAIVYAEGWAFIHFCKNYIKNGKKGFYGDKFERYLKAEIEGITDGDRFAEIFGLKSDRDWENLQSEFFRYLIDSDSGMRHYMYESDGRDPGFWPEEDEMGF